jgi:hypothetical protein
MCRCRWWLLILCLIGLASRGASGAAPSEKASLFDPQRHMRVAEVKPGMKGYGLSVFRGTTIERFDVEVVSILRNFNPKHDVILIRCSGAGLEHSGAISGMSGSPVYLADGQGRERMIGAFAYGWPLLKDPLAGVQPIEYMLEMPASDAKPVAASQPAGGGAQMRRGAGVRQRMHWSLGEVVPLPGGKTPKSFPFATLSSLDPNPDHFANFNDKSRLAPLASPLMVGGVPSSVLDAYTPLLRAYGMIPMQAGGGGSAKTDAKNSTVQLEPGSVLAVPMVTGDVDFTAIGTVTEEIAGRVFGFGHPFVNEGPTALPMGTGEINGVLARLDQSMKLGSLLSLKGALTTDRAVGVAGAEGDVPPTAPIELRVRYADGSEDETYRFNCALHPRLTPMLGALALSAAMSGMRELPQYHTINYDLDIAFSNGQELRMSDVAVNAGGSWPIQGVVLPLVAAMENPFERVTLKKITGTVTVVPEAREAEILSVNIPRLKYKPGETVKAFVTYRPFRGAEAILPIDLELPSDLGDGTYQLVVGGWERFVTDEQMAQPFRFTAESSEQVFAVLRDVMSMRHNALYVRLLRQPDGIAVGRVAMPRLPSSRRQVLLSSGRSNTTPFVSSTVKVIPTDLVMQGDAEFELQIDADERVETASGRTPKTDPNPAVTPPVEVKQPKSGKVELPHEDKPAKEKPSPSPDKPKEPDAPRSDGQGD